jgi:glycosyltransferase involved in cell wall biosynthesis
MLWGANWVSRVLGKLFGIPVVNGMHNTFDGYGRLRRLFDRSTLAWADYSVAVSDMVKGSYKRIYPALRDNRMVVIENGVSLQCGVVQTVSRTELGIPVNSLVIGTVGRFEPEKNQELLVRAFAIVAEQLPQAHLVLVGYGSQEMLLRCLVGQLGLSDRVCFVIGKPAGAYYPVFDCFVLSSPREGLALALLEAMMHEIPCVVANLDGYHSALTNRCTGVLADSYDERSLANAIIELISEPAAARRMGSAGKKLVEKHYTVARMAASYHALFDQCIEKKKHCNGLH